MSNRNDEITNDIASLMQGLSAELDQERLETMDPIQKQLEALAKEILRLERDMTIPGSSLQESKRVERLISFIEEKDF